MGRFLMLAVIAPLTAGACATLMPVGSHVERGIDFGGYRTYDWGPADARPVTDERLRDASFFVDEVHGAIDIALNQRGLVRADSEPADLLIHYHAAITGRMEATTRPREFRNCVGDACRPTLAEYDAGTLVIDLVDASTRRLIWRGWAEHRLEDMRGEPSLVRRRVQDAVRRIVALLPLPVTSTRPPAWEEAQ